MVNLTPNQSLTDPTCGKPLRRATSQYPPVSCHHYLERFVVLMYYKTSVFNSVNETRKLLFTRKGRSSIDTIPPTSAALSEHAKLSICQAWFYWGQSLEQSPSIPSPSVWGRQKGESGNWEQFWSRLPKASACCQEHLRFKCKLKTGCRGASV